MSNYEHENAIKQGEYNAASAAYFDARTEIDTDCFRKVFEAGFYRAWDKLSAEVSRLTAELETANAALDAKIDICGDETIRGLRAELAETKDQLETERLRLAGCGVAALGYFDGCKDEYRSASLDDVLQLRTECEQQRKELAELRAQEPVAWVDVIDSYEGPYNFNGLSLLAVGKHNLFARPVPAAQVEHWLRELLARIHGDGGHYVEVHGIEKAVQDADLIVAKLHSAQAVPEWMPIETAPEGVHILLWFPNGEKGIGGMECGTIYRNDPIAPGGIAIWTHGGPNSGSDWQLDEAPTLWKPLQPPHICPVPAAQATPDGSCLCCGKQGNPKAWRIDNPAAYVCERCHRRATVADNYVGATEQEGDAYTHGFFDGQDEAQSTPDSLRDAMAVAQRDIEELNKSRRVDPALLLEPFDLPIRMQHRSSFEPQSPATPSEDAEESSHD